MNDVVAKVVEQGWRDLGSYAYSFLKLYVIEMKYKYMWNGHAWQSCVLQPGLSWLLGCLCTGIGLSNLGWETHVDLEMEPEEDNDFSWVQVHKVHRGKLSL